MKFRMSKECLVCKNEFSCPVRKNKTQYLISMKEWASRRLCSHKCANEYTKEVRASMVRGTKQSQEQVEKRASKLRGKRRPVFSIEWRKNQSLARLGKSPWNKGIKWEEFTGEKHPRWLSDRSKLKRYEDSNKDRRSPAYKNWSKNVKNRDGWKCKISNDTCSGQVVAHHILSYKDYPELRYNINNGITLCQVHHPLKRAEEKRLAPVFAELVSVSNDLF